MSVLLLAGVRVHALHLSAAGDTAISANHLAPNQHQSFDTDTAYCVAPPCTFAVEPVPAVVSRVVPTRNVFLPSHPDGWYFNRPPPSL